VPRLRLIERGAAHAVIREASEEEPEERRPEKSEAEFLGEAPAGACHLGAGHVGLTIACAGRVIDSMRNRPYWILFLVVALALPLACDLNKTVNQAKAHKAMVATVLATPEVKISPAALADF